MFHVLTTVNLLLPHPVYNSKDSLGENKKTHHSWEGTCIIREIHQERANTTNLPRQDVSELSIESSFKASNTSKSDFLTWIKLLIVPSWLVTTGWNSEWKTFMSPYFKSISSTQLSSFQISSYSPPLLSREILQCRRAAAYGSTPTAVKFDTKGIIAKRTLKSVVTLRDLGLTSDGSWTHCPSTKNLYWCSPSGRSRMATKSLWLQKKTES